MDGTRKKIVIVDDNDQVRYLQLLERQGVDAAQLTLKYEWDQFFPEQANWSRAGIV